MDTKLASFKATSANAAAFAAIRATGKEFSGI